MAVTIKVVAKKAGVSPTTVSLVLNNRDSRISESTRQKVLDAAKELNYHPNHFATSLVTKRSKMIGVVSDSVNIFSAQIIDGIVKEAKLRDYLVVQVSASLGNGDNQDSIDDLKYLDLFLNKGIDGVIFLHSAIPCFKKLDLGYKSVTRSNIPAIAMDVEIEGNPFKGDGCDHVYGGYLATQHLIDYGHKKIGAISGSSDYISSVDRLKGYQRALKEAGLEYDPSLVYTGNYKLESGQDALPYLLGKGVTAIFAFNDMIALGIYKAIRDFGMSIPEDISIVGYDDIFIADILEVPLTTIHIPIGNIGKRAARGLIGLIEDGQLLAEPEEIKPSLMVRASTRRI